MPTLHEFQNSNDYVSASLKAILSEPPTRLALSGGTSPLTVYEALSTSDELDWNALELYLVDERYEPSDSADSNEGMIRRAFGDRLAELKAFHAFNTKLPIEEALTDYEKQLPTTEPLFDLVLVGLGEDGHTASLFPGSPALEESKRLVAHTQTDTHAVRDRLTLTFPALMSSKRIIFLIKGSKKKKIVDELMAGTRTDLPASTLMRHSRVELFYLNQD